jgi:hypothetical protein
MDRLTAFGLFAVSAMLVCYAFEYRSRWFILGAWPFGVVEGIWALVALRRWGRGVAP